MEKIKARLHGGVNAPGRVVKFKIVDRVPTGAETTDASRHLRSLKKGAEKSESPARASYNSPSNSLL